MVLQEQENTIVKAVQKVCVNVDKDELKKALAYDRNQYQVGFAAGKLKGYEIATKEIVRCGECKYRYKEGDNVVTNHCLLNHNHVQSDDWYCADGERKENDEEEGTA